MVWLEFNIHIRNRVIGQLDLFNDVFPVLLFFIRPFVNNHRTQFNHWHYLVEPDTCRGRDCFEIRLRFEGGEEDMNEIDNDLSYELEAYVNQANPIGRRIMSMIEPSGSHEGSHGCRGETYPGEAQRFGGDWNNIVRILEIGSENALNIFALGAALRGDAALQPGTWRTTHPYYTHLPANQLLIE